MRLRNAVALLLLALWLPATLHCAIEAATACAPESRAGCEHTPHHPDEDCTSDVCATLESGSYRIATAGLQLLPPALTPDPAFLRALILLAAHTETAPPVAARAQPPPELPRRWHLVHRTVAPARAPSLA